MQCSGYKYCLGGTLGDSWLWQAQLKGCLLAVTASQGAGALVGQFAPEGEFDKGSFPEQQIQCL